MMNVDGFEDHFSKISNTFLQQDLHVGDHFSAFGMDFRPHLDRLKIIVSEFWL